MPATTTPDAASADLWSPKDDARLLRERLRTKPAVGALSVHGAIAVYEAIAEQLERGEVADLDPPARHKRDLGFGSFISQN